MIFVRFLISKIDLQIIKNTEQRNKNIFIILKYSFYIQRKNVYWNMKYIFRLIYFVFFQKNQYLFKYFYQEHKKYTDAEFIMYIYCLIIFCCFKSFANCNFNKNMTNKIYINSEFCRNSEARELLNFFIPYKNDFFIRFLF